MKELADKLLATDSETCMSDLMEIVGENNGVIYKKKINTMMRSIDTEMLKKIAIRFSGYRDFLDYEDILCDSMGEDEFFDWADKNGVK